MPQSDTTADEILRHQRSIYRTDCGYRLPECGLPLVHHVFPSTLFRACVELVEITNSYRAAT
jgi:hypothetical protein